jgi:hypothetical protein
VVDNGATGLGPVPLALGSADMQTFETKAVKEQY